MNDSTRQLLTTPRNSTATEAARTILARATLGSAIALTLATTGCSVIEAGAPLETTPVSTETDPTPPPGPADADSPRSARAPDPADLMFQASEPFAQSASDVNVFGELDGLGPNVFDAGGKAGFQQVTVVEEGYDADQTLSPDGKWLLFSSTRHAERPDIYLQRVGGSAVTQLTSDAADDSFPHFSPDGTHIAFASNRGGNWDVYLMNVEGKDVRQITRSAGQAIHPSFSPDGTRLVYSTLGSRSGQWEMWTIDLSSMERRMIGYGLFPEWSPRMDKEVIAFQRARQRGTRWFSVWTLELDDGEARDLTEVAYSARAAIVAPTWSPDGKRLAFGSIADPLAADDAHGKTQPKSATQDVWTANADGSDRKQFTDGRGVNATPAWGRDGRIYFVSDRGGTESIWSAPAGFASGDAHARRARLPDVDADDREPVVASARKVHPPKPAAKPAVRAPIEKPLAEVPAAHEVPHGEMPHDVIPEVPAAEAVPTPTVLPIDPFAAEKPAVPATKPKAVTPTVTNSDPVLPIEIVDAPIVMQPVEPDPHDDHAPHTGASANKPLSADPHEEPSHGH